MNKAILLLFLSVFSSFVTADSIENWECKDYKYYPDNWNKIIARTTVETGRESGTVSVAGIKHFANFSVRGFNRRWNFGYLDDGGSYSFIIQPNGAAGYYEFSTTKTSVKPSMHMTCRQY